ncbi:hypothetical protein KKC17_02910 [Patescibacteria group bacterium]|nr:hypothetical protein [Patescibacteria group bacterium]
METEIINQIIGLGLWDADLKKIIPTNWQTKDYIILFKKNTRADIACRLKRGAKKLFFQLPDKTFTDEIIFSSQANDEIRPTAYKIVKKIINNQPISNLSYPCGKLLPIGEEIILQIGIINNGGENAIKG